MAAHAQFAAAVAIGRPALDALARLLYFAGQIQHRFQASVPRLNSGAVVSFGNMFLDKPTLVLRAAQRDRIGLKISGWGPVTVTPAGGAAESYGAFFDATVTVRVSCRLVRGRLKIIVDATSAAVESLGVRAFAPSAFGTQSQAALDSPELRGWISVGLVFSLSSAADLFPPFDVSMIGPPASDPGTQATLVVVDEAVVFGFDVNSGGVATQGDPTQLGNFLAGRDLSFSINPLIVPLAFDSVRKGIEKGAKKEGAVLERFLIGCEEGGFRIVGTAAHPAGSVNFSLRVRPVLSGRDDPRTGKLAFALDQVTVDVNPAWWAILLEVFLIFPAAIVDLLATMIRSNIVNGVQLMGLQDVAALRQTFALAGVPEPGIAFSIDAFDCHADEVLVGIGLSVGTASPDVSGPRSVSAEEMASWQGSGLLYLASLGFDALPDDPQLRIRWTVRIPGALPILQDDRPVRSAGLDLVLGHLALPWLASAAFDVECRLYRVFGSESRSLLDKRIRLNVGDRVDRSHPFVRWTHQVQTPEVRPAPDGSLTLLGNSVKTRRSKIHRTDLPGRCRMVSHFSQAWIEFAADGSKGPTLEYLDALPFARADLAANRAKVCDYCFYGGPTKTVPRIP